MTVESQPNHAAFRSARNELLGATSFLFGANAPFIEALYARYLDDPASVDADWQAFFADLGEKGLTPAQVGRGPAWRRDTALALENGDLVSALTGDWNGAEPSPATSGHRRSHRCAGFHSRRSDGARLSRHRPSGSQSRSAGARKEKPLPQLQPSFYGFDDEHLDQPVFIDGVLGLGSPTRAPWCRS